MREEQIPEPAALGFFLEFFDDGRVKVGIARFLHLGAVHLFGGVDAVFHEVEELVLERCASLAEGEFHARHRSHRGYHRVVAGDEVVVNTSLSIPATEIQWRFTTSGGPGGQHANKTSTRAEARFDIVGSPSLSHWQRARLLERLGPEVRVVADDFRSQLRNRELATQRLADRLAAALRVERTRRPTRATRGSKERRLSAKKRRGDLKRGRGGEWS